MLDFIIKSHNNNMRDIITFMFFSIFTIIIYHISSYALALLWWLTQVMIHRHRAAESYAVPSPRPPPEPDSKAMRPRRRLVVMYHLLFIFIILTHRIAASQPAMDPFDNEQHPPRDVDHDDDNGSSNTIYSGTNQNERFLDSLDGLSIDGTHETGRNIGAIGDRRSRRRSVDPEGADYDSIVSSTRSKVGKHPPRITIEPPQATGPPRASTTRRLSVDDIIAGQPKPDDFVKAFVEAAKVLKGKEEPKEHHPDAGERSDDIATTKGGLSVSKVQVRSVSEIELGRMQVSRFDRGEGASKEKLRARLCVKLPYTFTVSDFSKILSADGDSDVASMTMNVQTVIKSFTNFVTKSDSKPIYSIPMGVDFSVPTQVISAVNHKDLLTAYRDVTLDTVRKWQVFINTTAAKVEMESSEWCLDVLQKSTEKSLLLRVNQTFDNYNVSEQGGVTYFKLLVDEVDKCSFEMKQALIKWTDNFDIRIFDGENVAKGTVHFKAVITALGDAAPQDFIRIYLRGNANASNKEFADHCNAQIGIYESTMYRRYRDMYPSSPLSELDEFANNVNERFNALNQSGKWSGASHKASVFKATIMKNANPSSSQSKGRRTRFGSYYRKSNQEDKDGSSHKQNRRQPAKPSTSNQLPVPRRSPTFKSDAAKTRFRKVTDDAKQRIRKARDEARQNVYEASIECFEDDDHDLFAHLAGDDDDEEVEEAVNVGDIEDDGGIGDVDHDDDEEEAMAHAAITIDSLLNY